MHAYSTSDGIANTNVLVSGVGHNCESEHQSQTTSYTATSKNVREWFLESLSSPCEGCSWNYVQSGSSMIPCAQKKKRVEESNEYLICLPKLSEVVPQVSHTCVQEVMNRVTLLHLNERGHMKKQVT